MTKDGLLLGLPAVLDLEAGPPRRLYVFNPASMELERIGPTSAGSAVLAPGPAALAAEMVCLPADPPDPVTIGGDFVWLRRYQPNFTLSRRGDITTVEGL